MEGSLVPSVYVRGIFSMIRGGGGSGLGKPYLGNPSRAGNSGRWGRWGNYYRLKENCAQSLQECQRGGPEERRGLSVTLEQRVKGPVMRTSAAELGGASWVTAADLVLLPTFIRKPDCDSQGAAWVRGEFSSVCVRCCATDGTSVHREGRMACLRGG